ncbi:hypothetical protein [Micromonospora sp. NPDC049679]|uniref:hypothetical protein n=1 Tax=Micromonospora sp. NPDC049679 TaxID=3155920 RepID=UPI0033DE9B12
MIVGSLLLILVAVTLLVLGLANGSSMLLISSIAASLLAAVALVVGARQAAAARVESAPAGFGPGVPDGDEDDSVLHHHAATFGGRTGEPVGRRVANGIGGASVALADPVEAAVPSQVDRGVRHPGDARRGDAHPPAAAGAPMVDAERWTSGHDPVPPSDAVLDEEPPDEPRPQHVSAADAARVARLVTEVLVVDGRPRYHLAGCVHLLGRECEPLPVGEAVDLGFSPCSLCEPDRALLADARRV